MRIARFGVLAILSVSFAAAQAAEPESTSRPAPTSPMRNALASEPDYLVYVPKGPLGPDAVNEHFLVTPTRKGTFLAFWTQATEENEADQHVCMSRSTDRGKTWSRPIVLAGDPSGMSKRLASWQFPVVVSSTGRIYLFWNQNVGVVDARADTTGALAYKWSDDEGFNWSDVHTLPIRKSAISNPDPKSPENWVTYQSPIVTNRSEVLVGFTRWSSKKVQPEGGLFDRDSEVWFLRFDNILTERDGARLKVTTLPDGDHGLRVPHPEKPEISVAQEPTIQELRDGRFISVFRTRTGCIWYALSSDRGRTWTETKPLRFGPGDEKIPQPLAPCPLYKLSDGRFILVFHNNDRSANEAKGPSDSRKNRGPVFLCVGREIKDAEQPIAFSRPRLIADNDGVPDGPSQHTQIGTYPSLFSYGRHVYFWYPDRKHYLLGKILDDLLYETHEER